MAYDLRFQFNSEVHEALVGKQPLVALESTVITHGLPYPENVSTALAMEAAVRQGGATPATIAILQGKIHVGLAEEQIEYLAHQAKLAAEGKAFIRKCSRRDLPIAAAGREDGATTVAGTMLIAHRAGIKVFATGGIGGVHRGHPFDVSADLTELGRTPVAVVSSGAKSILDLPLTREVLETNGVPVIGYQTDEMPAFFSRRSGLAVDVRVESAAEVAALIKAHHSLALNSGLLIAVPVPETEAFDEESAEAAVAQAAREADEAGIYGAAATPWLLKRVVELTDGRSMAANIALLRNNGRIAGEIAKALANLVIVQ
jgi:pseudouridine-5'-phosphate glycosidase